MQDPVLAEELARETFVKAFRSLARFDARRRFATWVLRFAYATALEAVAHGHPEEGAGVADARAFPRDPAPSAVDRLVLIRAFEGALARLPLEQRVALVLRYQEGLSYAEIGEVMGVAEEAVPTLVRRGRRQMAGALAGLGGRAGRGNL